MSHCEFYFFLSCNVISYLINMESFIHGYYCIRYNSTQNFGHIQTPPPFFCSPQAIRVMIMFQIGQFLNASIIIKPYCSLCPHNAYGSHPMHFNILFKVLRFRHEHLQLGSPFPFACPRFHGMYSKILASVLCC